MKKLKVKVFSTIFSILTIFVLIIIGTSISRMYFERKNSVSSILNGMAHNLDNSGKKEKLDDGKDRVTPEGINPEQNIRKIYLDFTVYTVILDDDGNYKEMINHTNNDDYDEEYVKKIANKIINNHSYNYYVGNLYTDKYAYVFTLNNSLIIIDNTKLNKAMINNLLINFVIFILCEVIIFVLTYFLTKWIITPVKKTFDKQKMFIADASHELKTPLSVILASTDAYFNDNDDKWVYNIKNEAERMIKLVAELLDLAKTEKGSPAEMSENNLSSIIESSILTFECLFFDNNIELNYEITPDIMMNCNEDLIKELMSILIDNAIKYCNDNGKVFVSLFKNNKQIILKIMNTGVLIKKEDESRIFERFYKVDTSRNRNFNNYGLGLAIAKNIVTEHGGRITAGTENGYTVFEVIWNQK